MHRTDSDHSHQRRRVKHHQIHNNSYDFFNLLTSDALLDKIEGLLPDHRERLYPPTETLSMFLAQTLSSDRSCQYAVNQATINRLGGGLRVASVHTGGFCRARQRLPVALVAELAPYLGQLIANQVPAHWWWRHRRVCIVDGTTVSMPDTAANQAEFPQLSAQSDGLGFPIARVVGITCLASGALLNAAIGPCHGKGSDEQSLLRSLQDTFARGDIVLGDAFFSTHFFMASLQARGIDVLLEQYGARRRSTDFRCGHSLGTRDHCMVLNKPSRPDWMSEDAYAAVPDTISVREFKARGKILVTTLLDASTHPKAELALLYRERWQVELTIRHIKTTLGMDVLSCKTPAMVIKEIWVYLLAYNLIRLLMAQSAKLADKCVHQLSFKHCLQLWCSYAQQRLLLTDDELAVLFELMAGQQVGNRPGRVEPRAVKRRPKPCPLLMQPRQQAREKIIRFGHPRKIK